MRDAVIVQVARTPITKYKGDFAEFNMAQLGAIPIKAVIEKAGISPEIVDEVIMGNLFGGDWGNVARSCWIEAGFPLTTSAITVDRQCSSAVNAVGLAASMIQTGIYDVMVAGGVESYSQQPYYVQRPAKAFPDALKFLQYKVAPEYIGVGSKSADMIATAENLAKKYNLTREECDVFALDSHMKAAEAWKKGYFDEQVIPVTVPQKKGEPKVVSMDACVRPDATMESMAKLKPIMKDGVVTAGNASPMNDGASAILMMSREKAEKLGLKPLAVVREYCAAGVDPSIMGIGPVAATRKLMEKHGYTIDDFDLIELNEAFAAQSLSCIKELGLDAGKVNVEGGAIAIGHPNGCSGGMLVARLVYALRRRNLHRGLISFCCGGGQGYSLVIENAE